MQISSQAVSRTCAICDRSLLTGERALRYAPQGGEFLDVCPLCQEIAVEAGWGGWGQTATPARAGAAPEVPQLALPAVLAVALDHRRDRGVRADPSPAE